MVSGRALPKGEVCSVAQRCKAIIIIRPALTTNSCSGMRSADEKEPFHASYMSRGCRRPSHPFPVCSGRKADFCYECIGPREREGSTEKAEASTLSLMSQLQRT